MKKEHVNTIGGVLFFAQQIHTPWIEGVKNNAINICKLLSKRVYIDIISHTWPVNTLDKDIIEGVEVHYLLGLSDKKLQQSFYLIWGACRCLFFVFKKKPQKIFIQYLDTTYLFPLILIKLLKPRIPVILTLYSIDEVSVFYKKIFLRIFPFEKIIIISEYLREPVTKFGYNRENIVHIPLSYEKERYLKKQKNIERKKRTILFSAGPIKEAGSFFMVDLAKIMPEYHFIFAMRKFNKKSETEVSTLKWYIQKREVKNIEIQRNIKSMEVLLSEVEILILPLQNISIKMLVPVAILEAMARWVLCYISDLPNLKKTFDDNENVIIFEKGEVQKLKSKIIRETDSERIRQGAQKFAQQYPSFEDISEEYYKLI